MQERADGKVQYQEEGLAQEELITGYIYKVIIDQDSDLIIRDILELYYQELLTTGGNRQLIINVTINGVTIRALINSRATGNYIVLLIVMKLNIQTQVKNISYLLYIVDRSKSGVMDIETELLNIDISRGYTELTRFDITELRDHQIILRILQMKRYNLTINWTLEKITFEGYNYIGRTAYRKSQMKIYTILSEEPGY